MLNIVPSIGMYSVLAIYGFVVTPFLIMKFIAAYGYKPTPDKGYRPTVSVVIPVLNEEKMIGQTIDALINSNYPKDKLEIIVVNDGSTDRTAETVVSTIKNSRSRALITLINFPANRGKRFAFATGVNTAKGEIVVCVDSDSIVEAGALVNLMQPFTDLEVDCVCGHAEVLNKDGNILARLQRVWYADGFRILKGLESRLGMVTCCSGLLAAYRKSRLEPVMEGLLNETFMGRQVLDSDDRRLTNLLLKQNSKTKYQSTAISYTVVPATLKKYTKQQIRWGRGSFRGMLLAASFFWRRRFPQNVLFYFLVFVSYISPIVLLINLVVFPLLGYAYLALIYLAGLLLINFVIGLNDRQLVKKFTVKDVLYRTVFVVLSIATSAIYLYAWVTAWKGKKWMTR